LTKKSRLIGMFMYAFIRLVDIGSGLLLWATLYMAGVLTRILFLARKPENTTEMGGDCHVTNA